MSNDKIIEDIATLKSKVDSQEKEFNSRLNKLEGNNELLYRLTVLSEQQQHMNKNQQKQIDKITENQSRQIDAMSETFNNININITKLNMSQNDLRDDFKNVSEKIESMEVEIDGKFNNTSNIIRDVEKLAQSNRDRGKFDVGNFLFQEAPKYLGLAILGFLLAYFGLK